MDPADRRRAGRRQSVRRRRAIALVLLAAAGVATAAVLRGASRSPGQARAQGSSDVITDGTATTKAPDTTARSATASTTTVRLDRIPPARPGRAHVVESAAAATKAVALTFDDGFCAACVGSLVAAVERTGAHVTFCPNGAYAAIWNRYRTRIRRLVAAGTVGFCNHTWSHADIRQLGDDAVRQELERNERWIQRTFGVTSRPFFRPPYGAFGERDVRIAGQLGYRSVVLWSGTLADSSPRTPAYIIRAIRYWAKPGAIILGHGNYPATGKAFDRMIGVLKSRHLRTLTLAELLGA
jgi:peptidoglycan/xylan/chitin deacetylase (PgdA/CDA1 family)